MSTYGQNTCFFIKQHVGYQKLSIVLRACPPKDLIYGGRAVRVSLETAEPPFGKENGCLYFIRPSSPVRTADFYF